MNHLKVTTSRGVFIAFWTIAFILVTREFLQYYALQKKRPKATFNFETSTPESLARGARNHQEKAEALQELKRVLIDDYIKWHNETIQKLKCNTCDEQKVKMLILNGHKNIRGLGDRYRGILFSYLAAVASERLLLINLTHPIPLSVAFREAPGTNFTYDKTYSARVLSGSVVKLYGADTQKFLRSERIFTMLSTADTVLVTDDPGSSLDNVIRLPKALPKLNLSRKLKEITPYPSVPERYEFFPLIFQAMFQPSPELRNMMMEPVPPYRSNFISRIWNRGPFSRIRMDRPYISVHARLGAGLGEHIKRFNLSLKGPSGFTMESTATCMAMHAIEEAVRQKINPPIFYLATDTPSFREVFQRELRKLDLNAEVMFGT